MSQNLNLLVKNTSQMVDQTIGTDSLWVCPKKKEITAGKEQSGTSNKQETSQDSAIRSSFASATNWTPWIFRAPPTVQIEVPQPNTNTKN